MGCQTLSDRKPRSNCGERKPSPAIRHVVRRLKPRDLSQQALSEIILSPTKLALVTAMFALLPGLGLESSSGFSHLRSRVSNKNEQAEPPRFTRAFAWGGKGATRIRLFAKGSPRGQYLKRPLCVRLRSLDTRSTGTSVRFFAELASCCIQFSLHRLQTGLDLHSRSLAQVPFPTPVAHVQGCAAAFKEIADGQRGSSREQEFARLNDGLACTASCTGIPTVQVSGRLCTLAEALLYGFPPQWPQQFSLGRAGKRAPSREVASPG